MVGQVSGKLKPLTLLSDKVGSRISNVQKAPVRKQSQEKDP